MGPLGLKHEDLWQITNGELADMVAAHRYKLFEERRERALMTAALINTQVKRPVSVQDLVGIWHKGSIVAKEDFIETWKEERSRRREGDHGEFEDKRPHRRGYYRG